MLFNTYLEFGLERHPILKKFAEQGKLIAYADDMIIIAQNK